MPENITRNVYLPLSSLRSCSVCSRSEQLKLCAGCKERAYCSKACQNSDWPSHKFACRRTDFIDISTFYPLLACLADAAHCVSDKPMHIALTREIINSPNPGHYSAPLPDGSRAKLVVLGEQMGEIDFGQRWWRNAASPQIRSKMFDRIRRQGFSLQILTAMCFALLSEMYTTTALPANESPSGRETRKLRLCYHSMPIIDFGIVRGSARVTDPDKLAFWDTENDEFFKGDDPNEHYWIYFKTLKGEEIYLDVSMFHFNFCVLVHTAPYLVDQAVVATAPGWFLDRDMIQSDTRLLTERQRASVLRNESFHSVARDKTLRDEHIPVFRSFMASLSGEPPSTIEMRLVTVWIIWMCPKLADELKSEAWKKYPAKVPVTIEADPGEMREDEESEDWSRFMEKWKKQKKKHGTTESLAHAYSRWQKQYAKR